jgi:hypothetical protein
MSVPPRGLATLAMLKANYDQGHDHIDMFVPFVADSILGLSRDDFNANEIQIVLIKNYGLDLPIASINILFTRLKRNKFIRHDGGRYFRLPRTRDLAPHIQETARRIQEEQLVVANAFIDFAKAKGVTVQDRETALAQIFNFFSQFHVQLLLERNGHSPQLLHDQLKGHGSRELRCVAMFILDQGIQDSRIEVSLQRMLEGFVLQNTLLLSDLSLTGQRFRNLKVFFDTGFVLQALGLTGKPAEMLARETLTLLTTAGAKIAIFDDTIAEVSRILDVHRRKFSTVQGISTLRQSALTRYFQTNRYSPSQIAEVISLLPEQLSSLGIIKEPLPDHQANSTLDEADLAKRISRPNESEEEPRVVHDVACVSAVFSIRSGRSHYSYEDAHAVFATTTGLLVKHTRDWFHSQGHNGISPAVHVLALTSIAWLKNPKAGSQLAPNELTALANAALYPSQKTWDLFSRHLKTMRDENKITSDEMVAIIASGLTDIYLAQFGDDIEPDASNVAEVVERVRESYRREAQTQLEIERIASSEQIDLANQRIAKAEQSTEASERIRRLHIQYLRNLSAKISKYIGYVFFFFASIIFIVTQLIGKWLLQSYSFTSQILILILVAVAQLFAIYRTYYGGGIFIWTNKIIALTDKWICKVFGIKDDF